MSEPRIVSLIPSATEIVAALGFADRMVGRSHECDFPHGVEALPPLTRPKLEVEGTSAEVDARVKELIERGLAVYQVDAERLRALDPDLIVTQDQCQVCAASLADVEAATRGWTGRPVRIVSLNPMSLDDVWRDIGKVAEALGVASEGSRLVEGLKRRMAAIAARAAQARPRPRLAMVEWIEPLMSGGNWMPTLVEMAGGENLFGTGGERSPWLDLHAIKASNVYVADGMRCFSSATRRAPSGATPSTSATRHTSSSDIGLSEMMRTARPGPPARRAATISVALGIRETTRGSLMTIASRQERSRY
jgi:iron complex transport system substrate-binding protein